MKSALFSLLTTGLFIAGSVLGAEDELVLLKKNNCMSCHKMSGKLVGPGFVEIATKYKGDAGAIEKLKAKVYNGGFGVWGTMPMPPASHEIKKDDVNIMIKFILSQERK